jgi:hypothetical protein
MGQIISAKTLVETQPTLHNNNNNSNNNKAAVLTT